MPRKNRAAADGPFNKLADLVNKAGVRLKSQEEPNAIKAVSAEHRDAVLPKASPEPTDEEIFANAMDGVHRVSWRHDPHPSSQPAPAHSKNSECLDRKLMQEAIESEFPLTIPDHPEYIEGWVGVAGKRLLPNLRNGLYSIQGQVDLHGLRRAEAQITVEDYIIRMSRFRSCCIKIIHGRGINSPTDRATLKESLQRWLSTRRMSHYVVAYASAPARDGGVGAVYVLLSRQ